LKIKHCTVHSFGDGTFQITKTTIDGVRIEGLSYSPSCSDIIDVTESIKKTERYIYIVGYQISGSWEELKRGATMLVVIDIQSNTAKVCIVGKDHWNYALEKALENGEATVLAHFTHFSEEDQQMFKSMLDDLSLSE